MGLRGICVLTNMYGTRIVVCMSNRKNLDVVWWMGE